MGKRCKKFKYAEGRSNRPVVNSKKNRDDKITARECEYSKYGEYYGEDGYYLKDCVQLSEQTNTIEKVRDWTKKQRYIPHDLSDEFLSLFLSAANVNLEKTCEKIAEYFYSRQEPSIFFRNRDPFDDKNNNILEKLYVVPMPGTAKMGQKIIISGLCHPVRSYSLLEHAKTLSLVLDLLIWENDFGYGDFVVILNGSEFTCPQLLQNEVYNHRSITSLLLDTIPGTLRAFYLVSPPSHVMNVAKNRNGISIIVENNPRLMRYHLGPDNLPREYGGNLKSFSEIKEDWLKHMQNNRKLWIDFEKKMANYYRQRLCHEEEVRAGGKHWVQNMKLEADEWEYKMKYYKKMRNMETLKHPAYGSERLKNIKNHKIETPKTSFEIFKKKVRDEMKEDEGVNFYDNHASEVEKTKKEKREKFFNFCISLCPILEFESRN